MVLWAYLQKPTHDIMTCWFLSGSLVVTVKKTYVSYVKHHVNKARRCMRACRDAEDGSSSKQARKRGRMSGARI